MEFNKFCTDCTQSISFDHYISKGKEAGIAEATLKEMNVILTVVSKRNISKKQRYVSLIGDPCYRYKREAKEAFFKNCLARRLFLLIVPELRKQVHNTKEEPILEELIDSAKLFDQKHPWGIQLPLNFGQSYLLWHIHFYY